jgi:hypothetical protein
MNLVLSGRNLWIVDKKPQTITDIKYEDGVIQLGGVSFAAKDIYAALYCTELRNITFIIQKNEIHQMTLVLDTKEMYERVMSLVKEAFPMLELSEQGKKINGYASSLVEKLKEGIQVTIIDTKDKVKEIYCPECGMQCDPNIPYCLECGASI